MRLAWPVMLVLLAGCQRAPSDALTPAPLHAGGATIEWQGRRACADCAGIATRLVLQQGDGRQEYELSETFLSTGGETRFAEHGRWRRQAALLQLQGDTGSRRAYALPLGVLIELRLLPGHSMRMAWLRGRGRGLSEELFPRR